MDWENHLEKKIWSEKSKNVKIKVKLPHMNKTPLGRKRIFGQTPFFHYFKIRAKNFTSHFRSISSLGVTKITTPIWLQKSWKCVNNLKHSRTFNSKKFHWLNKKLDLERTMSELEKPFLKNQIKKVKNTENQCQNVDRENTSEKCKFDSNEKNRLRMNYEWRIGKNS